MSKWQRQAGGLAVECPVRVRGEELREALQGVVGSHQRFMLRTQLRRLNSLDMEVELLDAEVAQRVRPHEDVLQAVDTIPGARLFLAIS